MMNYIDKSKLPKEETLSDKIKRLPLWGYPEEDVKEKIQNVQRRLKREVKLRHGTNILYLLSEIDRIFKEEIGEKLI